MTPVHVVPTGPENGIGRLARDLAEAAGARLLEAPLVDLDALAADRPAEEAWQVHVAERLYGGGTAAAERLARWAAPAPLLVTFHDVPQAWADPERVRAYVETAASATSWAVNSHHEARLLHEAAAGTPLAPGHVVHLPVVTRPAGDPAPRTDDALTLAVVGWIYPDKGHRELVRAASRLAAAQDRPVRVACLGAPVEGHADLLAELEQRAQRGGVELVVTGYLSDDDLDAALRTADVPFTGHQHVSASASVNSWLAVGRRPLVPDGRYARELAALRPGTLTTYDARDPHGHDLDRVVADALADPTSTWLPAGHELRPTLEETVAAYRAWWAAWTYAGPPATRPELPAW